MLWNSVSSTRARRPRWTWSAISTPRQAAVRTARGLFHNSWDTRFGPRSARRTRTSSLVCASSAYRLTSRSHSPTQRCDGKACATRAAQSPSRKESVFFVHRLRLWTCQININLTKISMRCRTEFRATSGHFNFFRVLLDIGLYFFSSTPVVSGGASVDSDRPLPGDTTRCLYFTGTGGVLHREHPPFYWCLCFVLFSPTTNRQPSPQTTEFVHNSSEAGRFFPRFFFCGERTVLRRFLRFSRVLSLESSLSAHSCRLITRKSISTRLGRSFGHPFYASYWEEGRELQHVCVDVSLFTKTMNGEQWAGLNY